MRSSSWATLALGLKDVATRRGRAVVTVLSVALAVTIAVAIVGLGTSELDPEIAPTRAVGLPADPAAISELPVFPSAVSQQAIGRVLTLITALQVLLGGVAVVTLLAAASMSARERLRELGVLHALGCTAPQLVGASAVSQGVLGAVGAGPALLAQRVPAGQALAAE